MRYPKIETLFERDGKYIDESRLRRSEFGLIYSPAWIITEKIDGTNVRLSFDDTGYLIEGRTDAAQIPAHLSNMLRNLCDRIEPEVKAIRAEYGLEHLRLFGEGFGPKIQNGGRYRSEVGFILFDVAAGESWLDETQVTETAGRLLLSRVPTVCTGVDLDEVVVMVRAGFRSVIAEDRTLMAEGVVAKTSVPLYDRRGERLMWKLKTRDFPRAAS